MTTELIKKDYKGFAIVKHISPSGYGADYAYDYEFCAVSDTEEFEGYQSLEELLQAIG